jgi:hypothetical protein
MRNWLLETLIILTLIVLLTGAIFSHVNWKSKTRIVEIENIEDIIKEGSFVYEDSKYSVKKIDEKVWAKQALGLYPSQKENV